MQRRQLLCHKTCLSALAEWTLYESLHTISIQRNKKLANSRLHLIERKRAKAATNGQVQVVWPKLIWTVC